MSKRYDLADSTGFGYAMHESEYGNWVTWGEHYEALTRIKELEARLYDAYGLGIDDGIAMERFPLGLGGKSQADLLKALEGRQ